VYLPSSRKVITARHCNFVEEDTLIPKVLDVNDPGPACSKCHSKDEVYPSKMLLCDCPGCAFCEPTASAGTGGTCDAGWHMSCLPEPLFRKPRGAWHCPDCTRANPSLGQRANKLAAAAGIDATQPFNPLSGFSIPEETLPNIFDKADDLPGTSEVNLTPPTVSADPNISMRGRPRRPSTRYNPVFLALYLLDQVVHFTSGSKSATLPDLGLPPDPQSLDEAMSSSEREGWLEATVSEVCSLLEKGTFEIVDKPDRSIVSTFSKGSLMPLEISPSTRPDWLQRAFFKNLG